ncbi:1-acyl-sn-glycerol-3-phosphate acyltransferase [Algoriphagus namhaensis]|uniref:1-acyl-sn-glycerol-3-phosphate acyltransferase n=1 Tax=Algoriphagus namhaensis TaxID=915353 RepID=A0ABV8ATN8_9BACT
MKKLLAKFVFWISGWSFNGTWPKDLRKAVLIAIPHTSNWDLVYALAGFYLMEVPVKYTIKQEMMVGPLGWFLKQLGGIGIDRKRIPGGKRQTYTQAMINMLDEADDLVIMVTPEGTRSQVKKWKTGFYHIALGANVPVVIGYLDYEKKEAGLGPLFKLTGDLDAQVEEMKAFGRSVTPRHPEKGIL